MQVLADNVVMHAVVRNVVQCMSVIGCLAKQWCLLATVGQVTAQKFTGMMSVNSSYSTMMLPVQSFQSDSQAHGNIVMAGG